MILAIIAIVILILSYLNSPKVVYIDSAVLMDKYLGAIEAKEKIDLEQEEWKNNILTLETELNQLNSDFIENGKNWSASTVEKKQQELEKKQQDYFRYRQAIEEKVAKRENEIMQPIFDQLNSDIKTYGKKKRYDIILGTISGGNILYSKQKLDITEDFLAYANSLIENE